jgi:cytochrome c biogenesis protein
MEKKETPPNFLKSIWRFFATVKLTVAVLLSLAVTSVIGTVIPQNQSSAAYIDAFGEKLFRIFGLLNFFDMYHSWWFQLLLILLTVNVIVCSLDRFPVIWKIVSVKNPPFNVRNFRSDAKKQEFVSKKSPNVLRKIYESFIRQKFRYCRVEGTDNGWCLFGEKGRWTRLGAYIVHLSIIFLLFGGLLGSVFGFEGYVNIPEGETVDSIWLNNRKERHQLDFEIRCEDFDVSFYESGAPKEYRSLITIFEEGQPVFKKNIVVNDPIRFKGINIFQSSYGTDAADTATLDITSRKSGLDYIKKVKIGETIELPEGIGMFSLKKYSRNALFRGHDIGESFLGILRPKDGNPIEVILPTRFPGFDKMRKGELIISIRDYDKRYDPGLQVTHDPGVPVVYIGFIIMILGCFVTLFMSHQRICIETIKTEENSRVMVAGTANKNKLGMQQKIKKITENLQDHS